MVVIDNTTGKKIGHLIDIKLSQQTGILESIYVTSYKNKFLSKLFSFLNVIEIRRENIVMFGEDVIVVKIF